MSTFLKVAVVLTLFSLAIACEVQTWRECRVDHSWVYCMRVLHK